MGIYLYERYKPVLQLLYLNQVKVIELYKKELEEHEVLVFHEGILNLSLLNELLVQIEKQLESYDVLLKIERKLYNLSVECLQNIFHHKIDTEKETYQRALFTLSKKDQTYWIRSGNFIPSDRKQEIAKRLDHVNSLNRADIVAEYRSILNNGIISEKGGSGLGFLDMARKSRQNLDYSFHKVDRFYFFVLTLKVTLQ